MRKFRNTAIALVSAAAITLGGVTAATAQEDATPPAAEAETTSPSGSSGSSWNDYNEEYEGDQEGYGIDGFGSSRDDSEEEAPRWLETWGKVFDALTITSVLGLVVFPVVNFLKYNGLIK